MIAPKIDVATVNDDVRFRSYSRGDLDVMVALDAECFQPPFRFGKMAMLQFAEADSAWTQVATAADSMVGFCIVHLEQIPGATVGYLVTIDVATAHRRKGIGERMLANGESWSRSSGATAMLLHVYVKNASAIRFYERAGYDRESLKPGFYGPGRDAVLFWKRLER